MVIFDFERKLDIRRKILWASSIWGQLLYLYNTTMAEDQTQGKQLNLQNPKLTSLLPKDLWTSGQQSAGGVFLPWISDNKQLLESNKVPETGFVWAIQSGKSNGNLVLPWINDNVNNNIATITPATTLQARQWYQQAKNNNVNTNSWNEEIEDWRYNYQTIPVLEQWVKQTWNDVKKFSYRKAIDFIENPWKYISEAYPTSPIQKFILKNMWSPVSQETLNNMWNNYYKYENKINESFDKWVENNIDQGIAQKYAEKWLWNSLKEWDWKNTKYWIKQAFSTSVLPMLPWIIAWVVTRNPAILAWVWYLPSRAVEDQEAYDEAIKLWATREQATNIWNIAWKINWTLEIIWEIFQLKGFLKPLKKNITKEITKKTTRQIVFGWIWDFMKWAGGEWGTEWLQEIVTNALIKTIDENRDLFEWVLDSVLAWIFLWTPWSAIWAGGKMVNDKENNKKIDAKTDLEALDYVLEWEKRKAQRIEQQKEKMRQRANAIKNPTMDNGYTPTQEEAEQRAREKEENEQFEDEMKRENQGWPNYTEEDEQRFTREWIEEQQQADELRTEQNREMQIENDMINEVLSEWDLNEDLWDPRYQKSDSPQSVSEDTVREKSRTWNVSISSENSSEISKNLNEIKKNLEDLKADTFLQQIKKSISWDEKNSNYITNRINGNKYVLRIADHHANAKNSKKSPYNNTSIVIKLVKRKNNGKNIQFKKYKSVDMMEFVYNPENMTTEKMQGIIDWIQNWIKTGEYTDTNYDSKNQSTRKIWENKTEEKYQLKYEEEWYNPWVAGKNEKNISGKEWVNLRNKLNKKTVKELAEKYGIKVEVIEWMIKILENWKRKWYAYWKYIDQLLTLSEQIKESTAPHELLHAIFDMIDPETKAYLISQVMKSEGWSASKAEEWLADSFSNFFRTGKIEWAPKSTWWRIKIFFKRVRSFINGMNKWRNELEEIFTDIIESEWIEDLQSKIDESSRLNKSKERMRKRFMEYRKNAEKIQKRNNQEKYQKTWKNEKNEYTNSWQRSDPGIAWKISVLDAPFSFNQKAWDINSEAFKKRFGDSKVVDKDGNPLVVYHGTPYGWFTVFKNTNRWSIWDEWYFGRGWYFTNDKALAKDYSDEAFIDEEERTNEPWAYGNVEIKEVYLKIENPYVVSEKDVEYEMWSLEKLLGTKNPSESTEKLKNEWYDGVIYEFNSGTKEYTVFEPNQIKSATDNVGTYDANNDDIRYQKADIDPEATSPEDLIEVNDKWLDVMVKFVSEKQKKNALDVSKDILTEDGKPYMWTSTNKYMSKVITDWRNVEDSKYKEFSDKWIQIAWFTNRAEMSYSYANYESKLAPVKKFKSIDEVNKFLKDNPNDYRREIWNWIDDGYFESHTVYSIKEWDSWYELIWETIEYNVRDIKKKYEDINNDWMWDKIWDMPKDKSEAIKKLQEYYNERAYEVDWERTAELFEDSKVKVTFVKEPTVIKRFNTKEEALAEWYIEATKSDSYHYKGIIQKLKNPLIVDGKWKTRANLWKVYDFLKEQDKNMEKKVEEFKSNIKKAVDERNEFVRTDMNDISKVKDKLREEYYEAKKNWMWDDTEMNKARDKITLIREVTESIENMIYRWSNEYINTITEEQRNFKIKWDKTLWDIYDKAVKLHNKYDVFDIHFGNVYNIQDYIKQKLPDIAYYINHAPNFMQKIQWLNGLLDMDLKELLTQDMETNDFVFYALNKWWYDWVVFKNIVDYGWTPNDWWDNAKGWDVVTTFRSNQFKTWDNEDPTDSKYIRYQKADSNQKDNEWRTLSNGQTEYFKDSKVRDDNGNLLKVYHGTNSEYTIYDSSLLWASSWDLWFFWDGWYFATHKWEARYYGRNVMEWYLNITNPFYYGNMTKIWNKDFGNNVYVTIRNLWKIDESINNREIDWYKVSEIWDMVDDYLKNVKLEKLNDAKDPYNGWDITYWKVTEYWKSEIKTAMKWLSENGMLDEQLNHYMMDKVWYLKPRDLIEEMTDDARFDKSKKSFSQILQDKWYDGIVVWDTAYETDEIVAFRSNQFKNIDNLNPTTSEDIRYQRVYHWSPAEFDKFDSSHMWEWEWDQVHGRWHYVSVDPKTGKSYAETLAWPKWKWKETFELAMELDWNKWNVIREVTEKMTDEWVSAKEWIESSIKWHEYLLNQAENDLKEQIWVDDKKFYENKINDQKIMLDFARWLNESDFESSIWRRHLYEIEIPDPVKADTPTWSNYFEENKVLTRSEIDEILNKLLKRKTKWAERVKNAIDYDLKDWEKIDGRAMVFNLRAWLWNKKASKFLESLGYNGIHYFWGKDWEAYVIFNDDDLEIKNHEKYQKAEYEYDEDGNRKWIKFWDNSEFDPSIFWTPTKEEQIESDKENEKNNPYYDAWMKYNNQNYEEDKLTFGEFLEWVMAWWERQQDEYDMKLRDLSEAQNDPKMLELQLRAVKLMEEETSVGKKFWKNVSKEVKDRQQKEVETKREELIKDIFNWMYPWLRFEDATYDDQKMADKKESDWELMWRDKIEEKLKYFKKDKNGNWESKNIKIENPEEKWNRIVKSWNFDEIFSPVDRVIEWKTPQWQKGRLDKAKDPKQFKKVMEKINSWKTKTKVELKDVTQEVRALEKYRAQEEAEKERKKKERQEAMAKKKQDDYKKMVRMKAFQRLVDMQRFEKYPFLTEDEIKTRYGFSDDEWRIITEQEEIKLPKKRWEKAISDFNKAVDSQVKALIEWLNWQNNMKRKDAEKNLWEIGEIDLDVLLGKDEEKWQKEVEEFEKLAEEKWEDNVKKRLKEARDNIMDVEIDKERENSKSEKERADKLIKSTKSDNTVWWSIKKTASDIVTPVSTRIKEISPKIYRELMRYFQNKDILTNQRLKEIDPFLKAMWKIRKENPVRFMDIWVALANRNIGYANGLLKEYGVTVPTDILDTIYDEAEDVGLNINYLWSYYPLSVKAPKSFLEELMKVDKWDIASEIEKRIQQESQKKWWPLDESEITAIINSVIAWEEKWPDVNVGNKHMKKRNTEIKWTPQMLKYCDDPISTLIWYVEWMTQSIERAKFLWKSRSWNVHTLADYVYNVKNGLDPTQQDELMELLKSVFNDASPNKFFQAWRDVATLTTLGSPSSTLTQLSDLSFSVYENGWRETLKAVWDIFASRKAFDLQDMWVVNRWEEYTNINSQKNLLQKAIHNVFTYGNFFSQFDTFWKSTFIQSTWNKRRKRALKWENGDPQLRKDIMRWTDDEYMTDKIIKDLKDWVFSEEVALVMYMKLGNIQPLTKAQMPKTYLDNPNWRLFYQFKTFGIKQLDYVVQETKDNIKWWKNLSTTEKFLRVAQIANMVFIMTLLWVGADELKDLTMRRKSNSLILRRLFGEKVWSEQIRWKIEDNVLKLFGLSRYTIMQMKSDPVEAITNLFTTLPATNLITYPFKDIVKAFRDDGSINWMNPSAYQLIPVIWKYRYWIYWGGQDKQQEALDKENKTTTSGGSSRSTRNTRSRSRNTRNSR